MDKFVVAILLVLALAGWPAQAQAEPQGTSAPYLPVLAHGASTEPAQEPPSLEWPSLGIGASTVLTTATGLTVVVVEVRNVQAATICVATIGARFLHPDWSIFVVTGSAEGLRLDYLDRALVAVATTERAIYLHVADVTWKYCEGE